MRDLDKKRAWEIDVIAHIDVETNGLYRPGMDMPLLLEVALVLTDKHLNVLGKYEAVVDQSGSAIELSQTEQFVVDMHEKSGLWRDIRRALTTPLYAVELCMISLLDGHTKPGSTVVWSGSSPSALDRPAIGYYMPDFYKRVHYRTIDTTSVLLAMRNWGGLPYEEGPEHHRAMKDVESSIDVLRLFHSTIENAYISEEKPVLPRVDTPLCLGDSGSGRVARI